MGLDQNGGEFGELEKGVGFGQGQESGNGLLDLALAKKVLEQLGFRGERRRTMTPARLGQFPPSRQYCAHQFAFHSSDDAAPLSTTVALLLETDTQHEHGVLLPILPFFCHQRITHTSSHFPPTLISHTEARLDERPYQGSFIGKEEMVHHRRLEGSQDHVVIAVLEAKRKELLGVSGP